jgi:hypothetical protein
MAFIRSRQTCSLITKSSSTHLARRSSPILLTHRKGPSWYPNSHDVKLLNSLDGKLHQGTRFSWDTFGVHIESTVHEFVPDSRLGWFGNGTAMKAYHTFLLLRKGEGCRIVTEEVVKGPGAIDFRESARFIGGYPHSVNAASRSRLPLENRWTLR